MHGIIIALDREPKTDDNLYSYTFNGQLAMILFQQLFAKVGVDTGCHGGMPYVTQECSQVGVGDNL